MKNQDGEGMRARKSTMEDSLRDRQARLLATAVVESRFIPFQTETGYSLLPDLL